MNAKRFIVLLLSAALAMGSLPALAAEEIAIESAESITETTETVSDVQTSAIQNAITPTDEYKSPRLPLIANSITMEFTITHPDGAPEGRAVAGFWYKDRPLRATNYKIIDEDSPDQETWSVTFVSPATNMEDSDLMYVRCYVEELQDGDYVRVEDSVQDTHITFLPDIKEIFCTQDGLQVTLRRMFYEDVYAPLDPNQDYYPGGWTNYANIYRKTSGESKWSLVAEKIPNNGGEFSDTMSWVDTDVANGQKYTYSYRSYRPAKFTPYDEELSDYSPSVSYYYLSNPKPVTVKNSSAGKTMYLSWDRNSKASGYEIQYATGLTSSNTLKNAKARTISGNKTTSLTLKNRTPGRQYWVQARSYKIVNGTKYYSAWSDFTVRYPKYHLSVPESITVENSPSDDTMYVSWAQDSKASGYQVQYATNLDPANELSQPKTRSVSGYKNNSLTLKNRTPKRQYWVQVRSYKIVNGTKYYSDWSDLTLRYPD